ncbi:hypothetical protein BST45_15040 [Mycobacterium shinjukuense]|nr:hypothetical protein BST45_15040 [Mycobacterium shinjukuense]
MGLCAANGGGILRQSAGQQFEEQAMDDRTEPAFRLLTCRRGATTSEVMTQPPPVGRAVGTGEAPSARGWCPWAR